MDLPGTVVVLAEDTTVLLEVTVGAGGIEAARGAVGPKGIVGPSGTERLAGVLVKVEVPATLARVGVARLRSRDVSGSWIENNT